MTQYIMRLDDASEYMDVKKWGRIETLFDKYNIKPIVGVIPNNQDPDMVEVYLRDLEFWNKVVNWEKKGWAVALHGYTHVFETNEGGINPVNNRSEFAGVSLERQKEKIKMGYDILTKKGIIPNIFFAPAHTFDENTLIALKEETNIRIISDTIANNIYFRDGLYFVPQQSGKARKLPFKIVTFCYHPNIMKDIDYENLEKFLKTENKNFISIKDVQYKERKKNILDKFFEWSYFYRRKEKNENR